MKFVADVVLVFLEQTGIVAINLQIDLDISKKNGKMLVMIPAHQTALDKTFWAEKPRCTKV